VCQPARHTVEIGIYDNYFGPDTVTVGAGTVVRWINYGHHRHTSSSTAGQWDSGELGHGESFVLTFTSPGLASYYCRVHPREMRATLVVR
jgi:plastocyanin